jgi:hypothetical protein
VVRNMRLGIKYLWISFEPLSRFHEIWWGGVAIQGDLDAIMFNSIA